MLNKIKGSFRDPSGFLFYKKGVLYRNIDKSYEENYKKLVSSGLLAELWNKDLLIKHREVETQKSDFSSFKTIQPEKLPFISYPYEWCFSELKDAALLTLEIQKIALSYGMNLKDASAFNVQFKNGKPIFIDTLSFEIHNKNTPWVAYKQFCQHFLAPLALMKYQDLRLNILFRTFLDGVPLDLASSLLPKKSLLNFSFLTHIHLHAKTQKHYANKPERGQLRKSPKMNKDALLALISSLESAIKRILIKEIDTEWGNYYNSTNYSESSFLKKREVIEEFLRKSGKIKNVWDLGGNTGVFSRIASNKDIKTISFDIDPLAVEKNYLLTKKNQESNIFPLVMDLTNPSPGLGWAHSERYSLQARANSDLIMALAIIHHLCISNNLPFLNIAEYFSKLAKNLIIEFVPKSDSNVKRLLATREDIFKKYDEKHFEEAFLKFYQIKEKRKIQDSERILYLMETF